MKKKQSHKLILFGKHAVEAALKNTHRKHVKLYITKNLYNEFEQLIKQTNVNTIITTTEQIDQILPQGSIHQNIALETQTIIKDGIENLKLNNLKEKSCIIALDQISDQINIGNILRSAAAFDIDAVITLADNTPSETGQIAKAACGALEIVPLVKVTNLAQTIAYLQKQGYWSVGLDSNTDNYLHKLELPTKSLFILGSEHSGLRRLTKEKCDYLVKIAMSEQMESLNVGVAAALAMQRYYIYK